MQSKNKHQGKITVGRLRQKNCDRCTHIESTLYRVKIDESKVWSFICDRCLPMVKQNNPHYTYGGTWKAKKRH